jgi:threonine dehydratase
MMKSYTLSEIVDAEVWLKFENLQFTAAYKERGALNKLLQLTDVERSRGVVAASAGNHAQAVAYHGRRLGIPVTIVMPTSTPMIKVTQTEGHGANVVLHGERFDDAYAHAQELEAKHGYIFVHPFDDVAVMPALGPSHLKCWKTRRTSTCWSSRSAAAALISGVATAAKALKPGIQVVGVEAELYPSMKNVVENGHGAIGGDTLAEGIAVKEPGQLTRAIIADLVDRIDLVAERDIEHAVAMLVNIEKTVVEGAGAAGLAAILALPERFRGAQDRHDAVRRQYRYPLLANVLVRETGPLRPHRRGFGSRRRTGRARSPRLLPKFHECGVNIIETNHHRIFTRLRLRTR